MFRPNLLPSCCEFEVLLWEIAVSLTGLSEN